MGILTFHSRKNAKKFKDKAFCMRHIYNLYIFNTAGSGRKLIEIRPRNYRVYIPLIAFRPKLQIKQTDALALSLTSHTRDKEQITPSTEPPSKMTMLRILALFSLAVYSNSFVWERTKIRGFTHQSSEFYQKKNDFLHITKVSLISSLLEVINSSAYRALICALNSLANGF